MPHKHDFKYYLAKSTFFIIGLWKYCFVLRKGHTYFGGRHNVQSYYRGKGVFYETHVGSGFGFTCYDQRNVTYSIVEIGILKWRKIN